MSAGRWSSERDAVAYADALEPLVSRSSAPRRGVGAAGRELMLSATRLREMADGHGELYDQLLIDGRSSLSPSRDCRRCSPG